MTPTDPDNPPTWWYATTEQASNLERVYQAAQTAYIARFGCFPPSLTPLIRYSGKATILVYPLPNTTPPLSEPAQLALLEV